MCATFHIPCVKTKYMSIRKALFLLGNEFVPFPYLGPSNDIIVSIDFVTGHKNSFGKFNFHENEKLKQP